MMTNETPNIAKWFLTEPAQFAYLVLFVRYLSISAYFCKTSWPTVNMLFLSIKACIILLYLGNGSSTEQFMAIASFTAAWCGVLALQVVIGTERCR